MIASLLEVIASLLTVIPSLFAFIASLLLLAPNRAAQATHASKFRGALPSKQKASSFQQYKKIGQGAIPLTVILPMNIDHLKARACILKAPLS